MRADKLRRLFLDYFIAQGHREVPSSSLVPADDPTLLFTNAGMVQFKRVFLGQEHRDYARATTAQKCVRAGGKHNDLEQVGHTRRHHTFFEMLGNFSFGDYFKREAIRFAWEFVTGDKWLGLDPGRLRVTVHHTDAEARALWLELSGLPDHRVYGLGDKDNFWQMGDTGPCGPCTEIFVDLRKNAPATDRQTEVISQEQFEALAEAGEFVEIWNLVFMQFDRSADGTLTPLPKPSVDTGAGLERIAAVMQGEDSNFHTDLFLPLLQRVSELVGQAYDRGPAGASFRVLADHARAVSFLLADGVYPGNEGRGYVLRRILRRAVRHAWLLGRREPTLASLTQVVVAQLGAVYPELIAKAAFIEDVTRQEEERFLETIDGGLKRLAEIAAAGTTRIAGEEAFRLYDTFGFPIDLTEILAAERGMSVDLDGFERALDEQRQRSRDARVASRGGTGPAVVLRTDEWRRLHDEPQHFVGYGRDESETELLAFRQLGDRVELALRENPFYVESGGQVSDTGGLTGRGWSLLVDTVRKEPGLGTILGGSFSETFEPTPVDARIDRARRRDIERNHSATHLVHAALRRHLGHHVRQQGSLVEQGRLRFDFSHHAPIDRAMLETIERDVNERIWANDQVETREMGYRDALDLGAMAFFSEKYGDVVRVVKMGDSIELCGGTHVRSTGQLGLFRFTGQGGVAAGVRRIEAATGPEAYAAVGQADARLVQVAESLKSHPDHLLRKVEQLLQERANLQTRLDEIRKTGGATAPVGTVLDVHGVAVTIGDTSAEDRDEIAAAADTFRQGRTRAVLVLFGNAGRGAVHVAVTDDLVQSGRKAGDLVNRIASVSGGKGGGRPAFASAGAGNPELLGAAREATPSLVEAWLGGNGG
ncbi:MAG: alanine--tRNA ligase [Gemmatimonadota bacterium]